MFTLQPDSSTPLVTQIVDGLRRLIVDGSLRTGAKIPSIRHFAKTHQVSVFTVVEAYDRLVAQGYLVSRPHSGFFVRRRAPAEAAAVPGFASTASFDAQWYLRSIFENRHLAVKAGCGWLPQSWLFEEGVRRSLRGLAAEHVELDGYGDPRGHLPLREWIRNALAEAEVALQPDQVLLTHGSSHALDLAIRRLVRAGDAVLVDDPGYSNELFALRVAGARLIPVPRTPQGYDLAALEDAIVTHHPRVFFTQPRLQSPTTSTATLAQLHRVLQLADRHGLTIVENDLYVDLDPDPRPSLASLDQLARVLYVGSYSKTISPNLRVGYVAAHPALIDDLAQLKMISGLTSSAFSERLILGALTEGRWRKHLKSLRARLAEAHETCGQRLVSLGFELFHEPKAGMFLWARHPQLPDPVALSNRAAQHDIMLGPGHLFSATLQPTDWMRFNVAFAGDPRLGAFLEEELAGP
ncbi:MAG: PLP-dependent aminotransferase family protein [Burkholderiales bacterium]|jgi:DNA-binding transcriptional MocR family regulator|nr:PLP-dependent aminotransferase family protein [Burkholderiales bacterium]